MIYISDDKFDKDFKDCTVGQEISIDVNGYSQLIPRLKRDVVDCLNAIDGIRYYDIVYNEIYERKNGAWEKRNEYGKSRYRIVEVKDGSSPWILERL